MVSYAESLPTGRDDPLYREGMQHLQRGEYEQAIRAFEALQHKYPDSPLVQRVLEDAQLRANINVKRVRGKVTGLRIGPLLLRLVIIGLIGFLVYAGGRLMIQQVRPMIARAQEERYLAQLLVEAEAFLEGGDLESAEAGFIEVLELRPENEQAEAGLLVIARERGIEEQYREARALEDAGDHEAALAAYQALAEESPRYRDINRRIEQIEQRLALVARFEEAQALDEAGEAEAALAAYEDVRDLNLNYEQEWVEERMYELYMQLGQAIINDVPPQLERMDAALRYFTKALALRPRSQDAGREQQLLKLFLQGQRAYYNEQWTQAATTLRMVYDTRPRYLDDTVIALLYESYVRSGDQYRDAGDNYMAYEQYQKAIDLPVDDTSFAQGRIFYVRPFLTPTPTPTITPTPRPQAAGGGSSARATPVSLAAFQNRIVFMADYPNKGEIWVMNPDGSGRQRLGRDERLLEQFAELRDQEREAPGGDRFAFVQNPSGASSAPQIFASIPVEEREEGRPWFTQLTNLDDMAYDPVWSPSGTWIAFVSATEGSDDIWIMRADGTEPRPITPNDWEWDRHPSWSPDGNTLAFWSNRSGLMQLYVMNGDGTQVTNISNTSWDEYDPIWIK